MSTPAASASFTSLGLPRELTEIVAALGYEEPTPVQRETIPLLLEGRDLLGQAATGTGKTAAFALPMLHRISQEKRSAKQTAGLVLVPTRELAMQVAEAVHKYSKGVRLSVLPVYGGAPMHGQIRELERGAQVVVATPGRALDHIRRGTLKLDNLQMLVLDEADEMLDMGFAEDLDAILDATPDTRQTALFSATMPARILSIAERHLKNPARITIAREKTAAGKLPRVRQVAYIVGRAQKAATLERILDMEDPVATLVFCRTRLEVESLVETCNAHGHRAEALHGGMMQKQRDRVMGLFRTQKANLLIATDVAARGLDIEHVSHVVNYDVPSSPEVYVHRIGRTGRAGREGVAITLFEARERPLLRNIERLTGKRIEISSVPTVADLRARRMEMTRASLREALLRGGTDGAKVVVEALAGEFDVLQIATAAVHLLQEISDRDGSLARPSAAKAAAAGETPPERAPVEPAERPRAALMDQRLERARPRQEHPEKPSAPARPHRERPLEGRAAVRPPRPPRRPPGEFVKIYVSVGRTGGVRPGDLVGAITGEAGVPGEAIGSIEIADRFSLVEVLDSEAQGIVDALQKATVRGQRVTASRYRDPKDRKRKTGGS